ncbi:pyocin knob domain-containing protein, partial [Brachybacterium sp. FME24]|uniref:pyocin knob domain-containing protein n=1 Tax=Brachybacterium sp. FME24 TaxID=2742605 RepID=UPI001D007A95
MNGFWRASAANAATLTGLPTGTQNHPFNLLVLGSVTRVSTQIYFPYGFNSTTPMIRFVADISDNSWTPWAPLGGTPPTPDESDGTEGAWGAHEALVARFMAAMGGPIDTGGKAAVAIRFDHGLANFKSKILKRPGFRSESQQGESEHA